MLFSVAIFVSDNKMIFNMKKNFLMLICCVFMFMSCGRESNSKETVDNKAGLSLAVYENIMTRRSIRKYLPQSVERNKMDTIIKCGINAPNGMGLQSYEVRVVDNVEFINGITELYKKNKSFCC